MRKILIIITILIVSKYSVTAQNSYSLDFDGEGDYVEIIDESAMIANADQMTLSGWVYPRGPNADSWTQFDGFFGFRNNNDADFYLLQLGAYKVEGRLRVSGGGEFTIITAENSIISETWHHLALTYNGSNIILYIDGIEAGSTEASGQITNESVPLKIGSLAFDNTNFDLDGQVDEVSLWNLALTEQEIQNYMYAEPTGEEGLLGYWNFNEGSGETANDASGNENHGSIYGATWSEDVPFSSITVWYVTTTGSNSTGDGSEENPFNTIQHGLNSAYNGDTVLVAEGTYSENVLWPAKNGITLIGSGEENCIIDGGSLASVMRFEEDLGGIIDTTTLIRGFTITNGYAQGGYPQNNGGGIYCFESSPTLMNVTVIGNSSFTGGGIYCWSNSNPLLKDVTVTGNSTDLYGGGIYCYESSPDLWNVTITGNSASDAGGGFYCYNNSGPTLTNVTISDNMASDAGGGFYCASSSGPSLMNSISWNNFPQEIYFFGFHEPCSISASPP